MLVQQAVLVKGKVPNLLALVGDFQKSVRSDSAEYRSDSLHCYAITSRILLAEKNFPVIGSKGML
jgi:hypothetical protein